MAEEESNPGTHRTAVAATDLYSISAANSANAGLLQTFVTACAGMIVFLLLLWAAIGHRITARYHCSFANIFQAQ